MSYFKHPTALIDPQATIGEGTRIWAYTNVQAGAVIGKGCKISDGCYIEKGVIIGDNVTVKHHVSIFEGVVIEDDVFIGSNIAFINDRYPRGNRQGPWKLEKTLIKRGATLGTNATILCSVTVGEYAVVGAGSVVTKDVVPHGIVAGNPARLRGYACQCGCRLSDNLTCSCARRYVLRSGVLEPVEE